jgi:hypothetical protein
MQKCRYCGSTVIAPTELFYGRGSSPDFDVASLAGKAKKLAEINQLIHNGNKIEAIKLFRETFGVGLAEAKNAVDRMERGESVDISGMRVQTARTIHASPEQIDAVKKIGFTIGGSILATVVLSLLVIGGVMIAVFYFAWSAIERIPSANTSPLIANYGSPSPTPLGDVTEVIKIGGEGNGAGRFKDNRAVAVDGEGRIYSSEYSPHRIQVFGPNGNFVTQWAPESGSNLYDMIADRDGNIYLANDKGIFKHEGQTGKLLAKTGNVYAQGIALTWDGKILAVIGKSIVVMDNMLKVVKEYKNAADSADSTFGFEKITADNTGVIYALDNHTRDICKFSADGKFLDRFHTGANAPHAIAVDPKGRLFISDTSMITVLDSEGQTVKDLSAKQAFGIAFDKQGDMYVASRPYVIRNQLNF